MHLNQQQPPIYTTRHYIHDPQSNSRNSDPADSSARPYPYYTNNQPATTVTYINDRPSHGQQQTRPSYGPPPTNNYPPGPPPNYPNRNNHPGSVGGGGGSGGGGGGVEKTNMMSNGSPFHDPARQYQPVNAARTNTSITSPPKGGGESNKTLNLSEESPFHSIYGGYHYSSQIDPTKRITQQSTAARSTDNKSLNLSDESPFFSTYGRYHYPSQIDPQKRITEMPKAAGPVGPTNQMSHENPFSNQRPPSPHNYPAGPGPNSYPPPDPNYNRNYNNNYNPMPPSYHTNQGPNPPPPPPPPPNYYNQQPSAPQNYYNQQPPPSSSSMRSPSPQVQQPPARVQPQKPNSSAPTDKTSLNMSPDNPFASSYDQYHYPSPEEIKAQKRANERNNRFGEQQPVSNNNRPGPPSNQMTEYPESEKKDFNTGKGNSKFTSFDVNF